MTYTAKLKVTFDTEWSSTNGGIYDDEVLPEEHYTFEIPCEDINTTQLFRFFEKVALVMGHNDIGIMKGATALAFNDMREEKLMRQVCKEFELTMEEDLSTKFENWKKAEEERARLDRGPMGTVITKDDTGNHQSWEERYWNVVRRYRRFAQFNDNELESLADYGEKLSWFSQDSKEEVE